jgi:hypothetical protein
MKLSVVKKPCQRIRAPRWIDDIFSWQKASAVTRSLTLQYDKVIYLIKAGPDTDKIAGQHVTVFDYPDGRFKIRYEGRELPYSVFDRLSRFDRPTLSTKSG